MLLCLTPTCPRKSIQVIVDPMRASQCAGLNLSNGGTLEADLVVDASGRNSKCAFSAVLSEILRS